MGMVDKIRYTIFLQRFIGVTDLRLEGCQIVGVHLGAVALMLGGMIRRLPLKKVDSGLQVHGNIIHHRLDAGDTDEGEPNMSADVPVVPVRSSTKGLESSSTTSRSTNRKIPSTYPPPFSATPSSGQRRFVTARMVVDLGCLRTVAGMKWVVAEVNRCRTQGRYVHVQRTLDYFRFGDGERRPSKFRVFMEVGLAGHVGVLATTNAVDYPCPPLLSKGVCGALGLHLDCGSGRFDLSKLGVKGRHFVTSGGGHFLISIDEFQPTWPSWTALLQQGHQPKLIHEEVRVFELRSGKPVGKGAKKSAATVSGSAAATRAPDSAPSVLTSCPADHGEPCRQDQTDKNQERSAG